MWKVEFLNVGSLGSLYVGNLCFLYVSLKSMFFLNLYLNQITVHILYVGNIFFYVLKVNVFLYILGLGYVRKLSS